LKAAFAHPRPAAEATRSGRGVQQSQSDGVQPFHRGPQNGSPTVSWTNTAHALWAMRKVSSQCQRSGPANFGGARRVVNCRRRDCTCAVRQKRSCGADGPWVIDQVNTTPGDARGVSEPDRPRSAPDGSRPEEPEPKRVATCLTPACLSH